MGKRVNYEERFYVALKRITAYMTPAQMRRFAEREYGLDDPLEALEMAYENIQIEAKDALRGYRRKPRAGTVQPQEHAKATPASAARLMLAPSEQEDVD